MGRDSTRKRQRRAGKTFGWAPASPGALGHEVSAPRPAGDLSPSQAIDADRPRTEPWNQRYLEYARFQGMPSPDAMLRRDAARFPGGKMVGFILWISTCWAKWRELKNLHRDAPLSQADHDAFDVWLKAHVDDATALIIKPKAPAIVRPG